MSSDVSNALISGTVVFMMSPESQLLKMPDRYYAGAQSVDGLHGRDRIGRQPAGAVADRVDWHFDFVE
jgi:hypothetical protein